MTATKCGQSSHVSYRLVTTCQQAANVQKSLALLPICLRKGSQEAQIPSVATTCRKSGSFARDKVHNIACYYRGKRPKKEFFGLSSRHTPCASFRGNGRRSLPSTWQTDPSYRRLVRVNLRQFFRGANCRCV